MMNGNGNGSGKEGRKEMTSERTGNGKQLRKIRTSTSTSTSSSSSSSSASSLSPSSSRARLASTTMRRSSVAKCLAAFLALASLYALLRSASSASSASSSFSSSSSFPSSTSSSEHEHHHDHKIRIYLYPLPPRFTFGVLRSYLLARGKAKDLSSSSDPPLRYPGHQHSAEWWLFSDLLRSPRPPHSPVALVSDPSQADLFYVPFFSSLSLIVNPIRPSISQPLADTDSDSSSYSDDLMQVDLLRWLRSQPYWHRHRGRDHVIVCQDPNALYKVIPHLRNAVLLLSDFGRLPPHHASLLKDVVLPYSHRINPYKGNVRVDTRPSLLFFMGNRYRKEGGKIRDTLFQLLENEKDVIIKHGAQSRESRRIATQGMHSSKFCLHPAGDTPSACRLFDAIVSLCVPVVVSDYIELPFEDVIDYNKIAIFVDTSLAVQPGSLVSMLRMITADRILEYQREIQKVKHYFEYESPNGTVNEIWRQVSSKLPLIKLMINRDKRLVRRENNTTDCSCICSRQDEAPIR